MCLTRERRKLKISPGYRLRCKRIMVLPVDAENEQMSEFHSSFADSELVEVSHMVKHEVNYV